VKLQILDDEEIRNFPINPFDLTKVWPHELAPLIEVGKLTLNSNVDNYFAETEQVAFSPGNFVPGIGASPDKMLQARLLAYPDAQRYRVGTNYNQLAVNAPRCPVNHYQRDGAMAGRVETQPGTTAPNAEVNFYPNDQSEAPQPQPELAPPPLPLADDAWVGAHSQDDEDYFEQAGNLYRIMDDGQKTRLTGVIASGLSQAQSSVQTRMLAYLHRADPDYAERVKRAMAGQ
jgi:catalase